MSDPALFPLDSELGAADAMIDCVGLAAEAATEQLVDELDDASFYADPPIAEVTIVDTAGRALTGVRLDRVAETNRFHIVLLTEES